MINRPNENLLPLLASFPERFAFAPLEGEGVLLDLETGAVYELNSSASLVCSALQRGEELAATERQLMQTLQLSPAAAAQYVQAVLTQLADAVTESPRTATESFLSFEAEANGFRMLYQGQTIFQVDPQGHNLSYEADPARLSLEPEQLLKWAAPHVLALQHQPVLHASAVQQPDAEGAGEPVGGVLAFCGYTGAGKTTLARTFAAAGAPPVSEDLLLVMLDQGLPVVSVEGEARLHRWIAAHSSRLVLPGPVEIDTRGLAEVVRGPTLPLRELLLIDRAARSGDTLATESLPASTALVSLLRHGFAELERREIWSELLAIGRTIVTQASVRRATMPDGLGALVAAVRGYSTTTAS